MNAADRNKVLVEAQQFARGQSEPTVRDLRGVVKGLLNLIEDMMLPDAAVKSVCECGHPSALHGQRTFPCSDEDCTCAEYRWNGDDGGMAVTRSGNDGEG